MVENKTVGRISYPPLRRQRNFERCASTAIHHIYYLLFFIYYLQ